MAVSDFNAPSLTPAYSNILQQLQQRATMERQAPNILDAATQTVQAVDKQNQVNQDRAFKIGQAYLQHSFDTEMQKKAEDFQKRGEVLVDDNLINQAAQEHHGIDVSALKGTYQNPKEWADFLDKKEADLTNNKIQAALQNPDSTQNQRVLMGLFTQGKEGATSRAQVSDKIANKLYGDPKTTPKTVVYPDTTSSTGYRYAQPDQTGRFTQTQNDLEAPAPGAGKGAGIKPIPKSERDAAIDRNRLVGEVQKMVTNYDPSYVGFLDSKKAALEQKTGVGSSAQQSTFTASVKGMQNQLLKLRNGARITQPEYERLLSEIPDNSASEKDFTTKAALFANDLNDIQGQYESSLNQSGYVGVPEHRRVTIPDNFGPNYKKSDKKEAPISAPSSSAAPTTLTPEDTQAIAWAQANKSDPRAKAILKLHGL